MAAGPTITTPVPGVFYRRPSPEADVYVSEGGQVAAGDVVGLIEVMKTFYELRAEGAGVVERFLVEDGDPVEAGQSLVMMSA